jgi:hypothetical protein
MSPSSSGGVRIGRRMIGFGDFPESVDLDLARQRADRQRADLRSVSRENERPRYMRIDPNVGVNGSGLSQARAVSDCETMERESFGEGWGRRRGLSSPEKVVGLEFARVTEI